MTRKLYEKYDYVHEGKSVIVDRYTKGARINHWIGAVSMILLAFTGLMMYWPPLFPLSNLIGGGQVVRTIHPYIGVIMVISFAGLFFRFWRLNIWENSDLKWILDIKDVMEGEEDNLPFIGKYNFGQKCIFWAMSIGLFVLIVTGCMVWQAYFAPLFPIEWQRYALLLHSIVASCIIAVWIVHVYAGYWVAGSITAMTKGKISGGFAWAHHRKWYIALLKAKRIKQDH